MCFAYIFHSFSIRQIKRYQQYTLVLRYLALSAVEYDVFEFVYTKNWAPYLAITNMD